MIEVKRTPTEQLIPREYARFLDSGILDYLTKKAFVSPLLLKGAKGTGKTMAIEQWAANNGVPLVRHPCTEEDTARDFFGSFLLDGTFSLGSLTTAIDVANQEGQCLLVLEEINALSPSAQKMVNGLTDYRQEVVVAKAQHVFRVNPECGLWVLATMNPNYAGTYGLNEDLLSRFTVVEVPHMPEEVETEILVAEFENTANKKMRAGQTLALRGIMTVAGETRANTSGYALSTRDLVDLVRTWAATEDLQFALKELEGKYDEAHKGAFRGRVLSALRINLETARLWATPDRGKS